MASAPKKDAPPGASPKSQSPRSSPPPIEYTYMYKKNNQPTELLDALLRAIASYIICEVGDRSVGQLTPKKLAAFYKAVGGDYDDLFLETPPESISYMWQVTGCQHTLQPVPDDDFAPPTIPALTKRGFSRWESLEILLGPEEHVPFLQFAVRNWKLKHPETGQDFPPDLPKSVFPSEPDVQVDRWHKNCANQLKRESSKAQESARSAPEHTSSRTEPDHGEPKVSYAHVRKPFQGRPAPADPGFFERPVAYNHVPGRHPSGRPRPDGRGPTRPSPERYERTREERARDRGYDDHERRRSFSDFNAPRSNPPPSYSRGSTYLDPGMTRPDPTRPEAPRRHSQPRHLSSDSSDDEPIPPRTSRRTDNSPPNRSRFADPPGSHHSPPPPIYRHRSEIPTDDDRRRPPPTNPSLREKVAEKVSSMLPNGLGSDRPRNPNRPSSYNDPRPRRSKEFQPSRLSRSYSDLESDGSTDPEDSDGEYTRRRRERPRDGRARPGDFDREEDGRRDRQYLRRPEVGRRTSSHADMDRMDRRRDQPAWDPRLRDQSREERRRWEKRAAYDDRGASPMSGRRYPEAAYTKA